MRFGIETKFLKQALQLDLKKNSDSFFAVLEIFEKDF